MDGQRALRELLEQGSPKALQNQILDYHPADVAEVFRKLSRERQFQIVMDLNHHELAALFEYLDNAILRPLIEEMDNDKTARILATMTADEASQMLKGLHERLRQDCLEGLKDYDEKVHQQLSTMVQYPLDSAGAIMKDDYIKILDQARVKDAWEALEEKAQRTNHSRLFVVDDDDFIVGAVRINRLLLADEESRIDDVMFPDATTVHYADTTVTAARTMQKYSIPILPVVNQNNRLLGVVTLDDALRDLREETRSDYSRLTSFPGLVKRRAFDSVPARWLPLLWHSVLSLLCVFLIMQVAPENTAAMLPVFFLPIVLGMAGNTASNSFTLTLRGIDKRFYSHPSGARAHLLKETAFAVTSGLLIGLAVAIFAGVVMRLYTVPETGSLNVYDLLTLSALIGAATWGAVILSALAGLFIPFAHKKIRRGAWLSLPFLHVLADILSTAVYIASLYAFLSWGWTL